MFRKELNSDKVLDAVERRNLLAGKMALSCTGLVCIHFLIDFFNGYYQSATFDFFIGAVLFSIYQINCLKYYLTAKICGLISMNLAFVLYACSGPKEVGIYLYYFPLMAAASALFGPAEKKLRYTFIALPFALLLLLLVPDLGIWEEYNAYSAPDTKMFFVINSISSGIIMIMCIDFMQKLNEASEEQLQQLAVEVKAKNEDLEKTNTELDRFLYSTSHDLRSPLSSIKGLINIARYDTADKKILGYFNMMIDRVNHLENFIKDIIDYSKNARTELRQEAVDFKLLISEVIDNLKFIEGADRIEFTNDVTSDHPVQADKGRLSIILTNLMANAIKYHDVRKELRWIKVNVSNSNGAVRLIVSDNGSGISEEHQQRIFEMFYRGTLQSNGSGLGLYIVKQAVEKMQGSIHVESKPGDGASFFISVPVS